MSDHEQVLGDYVLLEVVGEGTHGVVHRGRSRDRAGRIVAIKRIRGAADPAALDRMRREAATLASLAHPAIVPLLDVVEEADGGVALVLPWAPGGSLEDVLQRQGALGWPQVADLGARLASALASAHGAGIQHRDVKPANVLLGAEDEPRLADFGTARLHGEPDGDVVGTPEYVDPAVVVDRQPSSPRSDGYSLGVVLYRALSGQLPHAGGSPAATVAAADRGVHPPLGELVDAPAELLVAVERAMARDPQDRFGSLQQLQAVLEPLVNDHEAARWGSLASRLGPATRPDDAGPPPVPPAGPPPPAAPAAPVAPGGPGGSGTRVFGPRPPVRVEPAPTAGRSTRAALAVVAVALVAVVVAVWLVVRSGDGPEPSPAPPSVSAPTARTPAPTCDGVVAPDTAGEVLAADVDGRGCSLPLVVVEEEVRGQPSLVVEVPAEAGPASGRYALGVPDDRVLVGDWDCDGTDTPAVHRPDTGRVFLYDGYGAIEPTDGPTLDPGVVATVVTTDEGCDRVVEAS